VVTAASTKSDARLKRLVPTDARLAEQTREPVYRLGTAEGRFAHHLFPVLCGWSLE
jgi:hypothetical protein